MSEAIQRIPLELLQRFTCPGHEDFRNVLRVWHYRGDLTETGDRRLEEKLGPEAYEDYHWDAMACTGELLVIVPRWKVEAEKESRGPGLKAEYYWALGEIDRGNLEVRPCPGPIELSEESESLVTLLPGFEWVMAPWVYYFEYSSRKGKVRKVRSAPLDMAYFRFDGGYGLAAPKKGGADG